MSNWHQKLIMPGALALDKLELTELKARDTSCPRGKKVELKIIRTIEIYRRNIYGWKNLSCRTNGF